MHYSNISRHHLQVKMLVDVHTHLDFPEFEEDLDKVIKIAENSGFKVIITNGTNPETNRRVLEISKKYEIVKPALGMYPSTAIKLSEQEIEQEIEFIKKNKPIAIGEVGLDNHRVGDIEIQKEVLKQFIQLSLDLDIPVIIHSRKAEEETIKVLEEMNAKKVIMHCFSGNKELTERAIKNGWMFSIPPTIVRNKTFKID